MIRAKNADPDFPGSVLFKEILDESVIEYAEKGVYFLDEKYIRSIEKEYSLFPSILADVLEGARQIQSCETASLYSLYVSKAMENRELFLEHLAEFTFDPSFPLLPLLCFLPHIPGIYSGLSSRGVPHEIILKTLSQFEDCAIIYSKRFHHLGLNERYFAFLQKYVDCSILNIGNLRFELVRIEDPVYLIRDRKSNGYTVLMGNGDFNELGLYSDTPPNEGIAFHSGLELSSKRITAAPVNSNGRCSNRLESYCFDSYDLVLRPGYYCLSVHIPDKGDFSIEQCRASYRQALQVYSECFPEFTVKAFHCESWMMAPELSDYLNSSSRILSFASDFLRYPVHTQGNDVLNFVFNLQYTSYEDLPEDTSLQRALKGLYLSGGRLYEYGGLIPL